MERYDYVQVYRIYEDLNDILQQGKFNDKNIEDFFDCMNTLLRVWDGQAARRFYDDHICIYHYFNETKDYDNEPMMLDFKQMVYKLECILQLMQRGVKESYSFMNLGAPTVKQNVVETQNVYSEPQFTDYDSPINQNNDSKKPNSNYNGIELGVFDDGPLPDVPSTDFPFTVDEMKKMQTEFKKQHGITNIPDIEIGTVGKKSK